VSEYNAVNDHWLEIITSSKGLGTEGGTKSKFQMFFMASYNLDKFRKFIFESRFFDLFKVPSDLKEKMASNDVVLMKFAFDWLKFSLYGDKTLQLKSYAAPP
jgi:hypothetical protein